MTEDNNIMSTLPLHVSETYGQVAPLSVTCNLDSKCLIRECMFLPYVNTI